MLTWNGEEYYLLICPFLRCIIILRDTAGRNVFAVFCVWNISADTKISLNILQIQQSYGLARRWIKRLHQNGESS